MKLSPICAASLLLLGLSASAARAQEQPKTEEKAKSEEQITPLKVTVVFNEYDGEKKVSSLPYVLFLKAGAEHREYWGSVRMGLRVPIWTGAKDSAIQYQDVGSNIDCWARPAAPGDRYAVDLRLVRQSLYAAKDDHPVDQKPDETHQPVMREFRSNSTITLRDGQTTQSIMATDPLNGHTIRVDVTLNVLR